jgi:hypothetical protein
VKRPLYTGDLARDTIVDELIAIERRIRVVESDIARRIEHGIGLRSRDQRRRLRELREALAERGVLRHIERTLTEREAA